MAGRVKARGGGWNRCTTAVVHWACPGRAGGKTTVKTE